MDGSAQRNPVQADDGGGGGAGGAGGGGVQLFLWLTGSLCALTFEPCVRVGGRREAIDCERVCHRFVDELGAAAVVRGDHWQRHTHGFHCRQAPPCVRP